METYESLDRAFERILRSEAVKKYKEFIQKYIEDKDPKMLSPSFWNLETNQWAYDRYRMSAWIGLYLEKKKTPKWDDVVARREELIELEAELKKLNEERKSISDKELDLKIKFRTLIGDHTKEDDYVEHFWSGRYMSK